MSLIFVLVSTLAAGLAPQLVVADIDPACRATAVPPEAASLMPPTRARLQANVDPAVALVGV